jgi:hypothetical protein
MSHVSKAWLYHGAIALIFLAVSVYAIRRRYPGWAWPRLIFVSVGMTALVLYLGGRSGFTTSVGRLGRSSPVEQLKADLEKAQRADDADRRTP